MILRYDVLNRLAERIGARRYLEIGVLDGTTFDAVSVAEKVSVDPGPVARVTHRMTSDAYFEALQPAERFDLVFVDGDHVAEQVVRDVENALRHLSPGGAIVVHDCSPPNEGYTARFSCGTVFRGWIEIRQRHVDTLAFVVDVDLGCGVVVPGAYSWGRSNVDPNLPWDEFEARREEALGLVGWEMFREIVAGLEPISR